MADLTTTAAVKAYAGIPSATTTDDAAIAVIVTAVSALMHEIVGHDYEGDSITAEKHWSPASGALVLKKPAASIDAVRENGTTLASGDYELVSDRLVYRMDSSGTVDWSTSARRIEVDYTTVSTVPAPLELAAREICTFIVKQSAFTGGAARLGLGAQANADTGSADYFVQALNRLPVAAMTLKRYRGIV